MAPLSTSWTSLWSRYDPSRVNVADVNDAGEKSGSPIPVGTLDTDGMELPIIVDSATNTLKRFREIPISTSTAPVLFSEVAEVSVKADEATSITRTNSAKTLSTSITKTHVDDTVSITFAATNSIGVLLLTGIPLGLPSLIGMLMLVGTVVTKAIVLINQYRLKPRYLFDSP